MNYYPEIIFEKIEDAFTGGTKLIIKTILRLKSEQGFYFTYKLWQSYTSPVESEVSTAQIVSDLYRSFIKQIEKSKQSIYDPNIKGMNGNKLMVIDKYQGEVDEFDPKYMFQFYDSDWSIEELIEVNDYMKEFLNK